MALGLESSPSPFPGPSAALRPSPPLFVGAVVPLTSKRKRVAPQLVSDEEILERLRQSPYVPPKPRKKRPLPRMPTELPGPSSIWNVYDGPRALPRPLGIVNEKDRMRAEIAAMREWPDRPLIRVVRALDDPQRRRELVRPAFLLPHVTARVQ